MSKPKKRVRQSPDPWATMPNAERGRPMVTLTMSHEGLAELERQRGVTPRGAYVEQLLDTQKDRKKKTGRA